LPPIDTIGPAETRRPTSGVRVRAVPGTREFVAGGQRNVWGNGRRTLRALPTAIDDITADFGDDLYDRMLNDPQVAAAGCLLKLSILSQGVRLTPPVQKEDEGYEQALDILRFVDRNFRRLDTPLDQVLYELLDGMFFGYKMAEKIFEIPPAGEDKGRLCLRNVKVKPRSAVAFVVDAFMNTVGILAVEPTKLASTLRTGYLVGDEDNILPREKFVVFNYRTKDSDPRGSSILRAAYSPWWYKKQVEPDYLTYLALFAIPGLDGVLPEGAAPTPYMNEAGEYTDAAGVVLVDQNLPVYTNPPTDYLNSLLEFHNAHALVRPFGSDLNLINPQGDGQPFRFFLQYCNDEIVQSLLGQTLATTESRNMARAASQTHQDVLDMFVGEGKGTLAYTIKSDIVDQLVLLNFGPDALDLAPTVTLPATEHQDFAANAQAIASLLRAGWPYAPSQYAKVENWLGMPVRTEEEAERLQEQMEEDREMAMAAQEAAQSAEEEDGGGGSNPEEAPPV
jgi:hypothetical protein